MKRGVCSLLSVCNVYVCRKVYPPPSGRHAMRCLNVIGRESWVREMSCTYWLDIHSSHGVGEYSVTAVCPRAGGMSRRRSHEIIVAVVAVVAVVGVSCRYTCSVLLSFLFRLSSSFSY